MISPWSSSVSTLDCHPLQEEISDRLGAAVAIRSSKKGSGKITIEFGDLDQLEGILGRLR